LKPQELGGGGTGGGRGQTPLKKQQEKNDHRGMKNIKKRCKDYCAKKLGRVEKETGIGQKEKFDREPRIGHRRA